MNITFLVDEQLKGVDGGKIGLIVCKPGSDLFIGGLIDPTTSVMVVAEVTGECDELYEP